MKHLRAVLWVAFGLISSLAMAESGFTIEITKGYDQPITIAAVPFDTGELVRFDDVAQIVESDLGRTGQFSLFAREKMGSRPSKAKDVLFREWRLLGQDYLLIGSVSPVGDKVAISYVLFDTFQEVQLVSKTYTASATLSVDIAHRIADDVYEAITGTQGAFATKVAFVVERQAADGYMFDLIVADSDGNRATTLYSSSSPIISPAWHPDGSHIAAAIYNDRGRTGIVEFDLKSKNQRTLIEPMGQATAPAYSPDGSQLAFTVLANGSSDIFVLDLGTMRRQQLTTHWAIDTEPEWSRDGKSIFFTSDRSGRPQIYRLQIGEERAERVSFEGKYNARPRLLPEGDALVVIHQPESGVSGFQLMRIDLNTGSLWPLTEPSLDESPSIAPNGTMVVYAEKVGSNSRLAWVSVDGEVKSSMPVLNGSVKEPSWSPFLR